MKSKEELIESLMTAIETSDTLCGDHILVRKADAIRILQLLAGTKDLKIRKNPQFTEGGILFYCADCSKSFRTAGREDPECYEKWQYHTWYASCPWCKREVSQNDRYWR